MPYHAEYSVHADHEQFALPHVQFTASMRSLRCRTMSAVTLYKMTQPHLDSSAIVFLPAQLLILPFQARTNTMLHQTIAAYHALRASSTPLPPGIAPPTTSYSFRMHPAGSGTPAKRWVHQLSIESQHCYASTLKASSRPTGSSDIISLGTARPAGRYFP